jgi:UDP-glucose 4-epimerase
MVSPAQRWRCAARRARELISAVWGTGVLLRLVHNNPFEYGVQRRVPGRAGARNVLGFEAATTLDEVLDEVIAWIDGAIKDGTI